MLNLLGPKQRFCDGISRRNFLRIGGLAMGGLGLADVLRLEAATGQKSASHKAIIMIFLPGGPPHQDMVDLKPDAPKDIRGEFKPINTNVTGIQICEHLPRLAGMMDKLAIVRSIVGCRDEHASDQCLSGYTPSESRLIPGGRPSLGSILAKIEGPVDKAVPPFVGLAPKMDFSGWANPGGPGFLGRAYAPFHPEGESMADMTLKGISADQLHDRKALLTSFDNLRRDIDSAGTFEALDAFNQRALDVLTSKKLIEALDVTREDPRLRDRYGIGSSKNVDDGGPCWNDQFVIARRLVEAGVRCVTLAFGRWGLSRKQLRAVQGTPTQARSSAECAHTRLARPRPGSGCVRRGLGRIWAHTAHQQGSRARSLGTGFLRPIGGRRHEDGPSDRFDESVG
jgi:hypothetical protein